ncbi:hypothetical protein CYY_003931 [Polysphondylium violaceum]|uniref:RNA helicase n=1 Tax=Polysphondylium violaceum TaxID=133409 RepID=A0A8J4PW25_9MYCE|nr:hypothetical protein CYY_003931 [Polysphondylium violaceum]
MSTNPLKKALSKNKKLTREERLKATIRGKIDKHAERKKLMEDLVSNSMSSENRDLLKASSSLGKKETNKESIQRQKKEIELKVVGAVPKDKYQRDVPLDKKVIRPDNIPEEWDDVLDPIVEKSVPIQVPQLEPETLDRLAVEKIHKQVEKRRQEKSKKKFFFWKEEDVERDYVEYQDQSQEKGSYLKDPEDPDQESDSEDENTVQLAIKTSKEQQDKMDTTEKEKEESITKQDKVVDKKLDDVESNKKRKGTSNNVPLDTKKSKQNKQDTVAKSVQETITTNATTTSTTTTKSTTGNRTKTKANKTSVQVEEEKIDNQDEIVEDKETLVKEDLERYNLSMEVFGKMEEEAREIFLTTTTGIEKVENQLKDVDPDLIQEFKYSVFHVQVNRLPEVVESRENLPIMMEEHNIVEKIKDNDVIIICGETGSGKTTQVPQFLYEAGFGHQDPRSDFPGIIGVTQPRRVAAVSTAQRVAHELNVEFGKEVGYQIRYDKKLDTSINKIKFMTDGILMREVQSDLLLTNYSAILIDEAHERNLNTDILIGLLSRIVPLRKKLYLKSLRDPTADRIKPLKLVIMSATLRVEDFTKNTILFRRPPPVINIPTRQFPVTIHFNKKTELVNYIDEAYKKVVKIHKRLPAGGILVFVTGKQEIEQLCSKLRRAYPMKAINQSFKESMDKIDESFKDNDDQNDVKTSKHIYGDADDFDFDNEVSNDFDEDFAKDNHDDFDQFEVLSDSEMMVEENEEVEQEEEEEEEPEENEEQEEVEEEEEEEQEENEENEQEEVEEEGEQDENEVEVEEQEEQEENETKDEEMKDKENEEEEEEDGDDENTKGPLYVLPLYSTLPTAKQMRVFQKPPLGARLVVVATNLAETSLTIPNIKYVVDTGRVKGRFYNKDNGISSFEVSWTSKASADQRAGRAGRTGPGHCYRIYSSAVYNDHFEQFSKPEILLIPIDGMILQMKSMGIQKITGFPFPTPPDEVSLKVAIRTLVNLGALEMKTCQITELGNKMAQFPVHPRHSKMILLGQEQNCLPFVLAIVSILTVKDPFIREAYENPNEQEQPIPEDLEETEKQRLEKERENRRKHQQRLKNSMRKWQHKDSDIISILKVVGAYDYQARKTPDDMDSFCETHFLNPKSMSEIHKLRYQLSEIVNSIVASQTEDPTPVIDISKPLLPPTSTQELIIKQVITAGLIDQVSRIKEGSSFNKNLIEFQTAVGNIESTFIHPTSNLFQQSPEYVVYCDIIETSRPYMKLVTEINPSWLALLGKPLCTDFKPLDQPEPSYSPKHDMVRCCVKPMFGTHFWEMPLMKIPHPDKTQRLRYFAKALLDGEVFNPLIYLVPYLSTISKIVTQPNTQVRVYKLIQALKSKSIDTKERLLDIWLEDPNFLYAEYCLWFDVNIHKTIKEMWPPLDSVNIPLILMK